MIHGGAGFAASKKVFFVGESTPLRTLRTWCRGRGLVITDAPGGDLLCAVVDDKILHSPDDFEHAEQLRTCRSLGVECLSPGTARTLLIDTLGFIRGPVGYQHTSGEFGQP